VVSGQLPESRKSKVQSSKSIEIATAVRKRIKHLMWERVGILRDANSLKRALREIEQIEQANLGASSRNFVTVAKLVAKAALWREESRGGHFRTDYPEADEKWRAHSIQKIGAEISSSKKINFTKKTKFQS
jgi:aspartate oxidase